MPPRPFKVPEIFDGRECVVFFDFDNTVTHFDVLDSIIERFSINKDWVAFERAWREEKIGSKECLKGQMRSVRVQRELLSNYLAAIEIDPFFVRLLALLRRNKIATFIVSDSFSVLIKEILRHHGVSGIKIYANRLKFRGEKLIPIFPFASEDCSRCAHCKKRHVLEHCDKITVYVGDGLSDLCPARRADLVFAKGTLWEHLKGSRENIIHFNQLEDVYGFFEKREPVSPKMEKIFAVA